MNLLEAFLIVPQFLIAIVTTPVAVLVIALVVLVFGIALITFSFDHSEGVWWAFIPGVLLIWIAISVAIWVFSNSVDPTAWK